MSRFIDADKTLEYLNLMYDKQNDMDEPYNCAVLAMINHIKNKAPSIDLADYVPKEFHDKTCEAMAKRHQEEIADMVRVVRCKECRHHFYDELNDCKMCYIHEYGETWEDDDYCSYGVKKGADDETD